MGIGFGMWFDTGGGIFAEYDGDVFTADTTEVVNPGNSNTYPIITITGPGVLRSIKNYSTGKFIWFNLLIQSGEVVEISLDPDNIYVTSNVRGNLLSSVLAGSNLTELYLKPGKNIISTFISGDRDITTGASIRFTPSYGSLP
jgi:phage-related protein